MSSRLRFVVEEQPASTFFKDEGGKSNQLFFRVKLVGGSLSAEDIARCAGGGAHGVIPLKIETVFANGEVADRPGLLEVVGGCGESHETPTPSPCLVLAGQAGGVRYRLSAVSKRVGNRGLAVRVSLPELPHIASVTSSSTMVFSKRKNRDRPPMSSPELSDGGDEGALPVRKKTRPIMAAAVAKNIEERIEDLGAEQKKLFQVVFEQKKLLQVVFELKKPNHQVVKSGG